VLEARCATCWRRGCGHIVGRHRRRLREDPARGLPGAALRARDGGQRHDRGACNAYFAKGQAGFAFAALIYGDDAPYPFKPTAPGAHAVSGVGDQAYWTTADGGPRLEAMKGKVRCEIDPPHAAQSALKSMAEADQNAFAQLMGKLCNDIFAAQ
jgi:hypothetical protein